MENRFYTKLITTSLVSILKHPGNFWKGIPLRVERSQTTAPKEPRLIKMVLETRKKTNPNTIPNSRWVFDDPVDVVRSYTFQWMHWEKFKVYRTLAVPIRRSTIQTLLGFQDQMRSGYSGW